MKRRMGERGQALPLIGLSLMVMMGIGALTIDLSYLEYQQTRMQSATDAAAIAGAQQLITHGCPDSADATTAAQNDSQIDNFAPGANTAVTVDNPPSALDGPYQGDNCAVHVSVKVPQSTTWFLKLFGYPSMPVETSAVAEMQNSNPGCIYLLSPVSQSTFNGDVVNSPGCAILINDTATFNGDSTFAAKGIGYAGAAPIENGTNFTIATPAPMLPVADPCPEITGCASLTANPPPITGCSSVVYNGQATVTIQPGCYNSLIVNGCPNVTFAPGGTFVFNGTTIINGETNVTGNGVTLYVTASGTPPTFNGIPNVSLSAPTSGTSAGVLYYQVPGNAQPPIFNGVSQNMSGLIYAPSALNVITNGSSGGYLVLVFGSAIFNGATAYDFANPVNGQTLPKTVVLVQ
ncbi:MAG: pilus assembly protein TadG-related protein [Candidatus Cybelea sp.]